MNKQSLASLKKSISDKDSMLSFTNLLSKNIKDGFSEINDQILLLEKNKEKHIIKIKEDLNRVFNQHISKISQTFNKVSLFNTYRKNLLPLFKRGESRRSSDLKSFFGQKLSSQFRQNIFKDMFGSIEKSIFSLGKSLRDISSSQLENNNLSIKTEKLKKIISYYESRIMDFKIKYKGKKDKYDLYGFIDVKSEIEMRKYEIRSLVKEIGAYDDSLVDSIGFMDGKNKSKIEIDEEIEKLKAVKERYNRLYKNNRQNSKYRSMEKILNVLIKEYDDYKYLIDEDENKNSLEFRLNELEKKKVLGKYSDNHEEYLRDKISILNRIISKKYQQSGNSKIKKSSIESLLIMRAKFEKNIGISVTKKENHINNIDNSYLSRKIVSDMYNYLGRNNNKSYSLSKDIKLEESPKSFNYDHSNQIRSLNYDSSNGLSMKNKGIDTFLKYKLETWHKDWHQENGSLNSR